MIVNELIEQAKKARALSYSPYSHFAVGAAVLTVNDQVFLGANMENASYPCGTCAERVAIHNALMNGVKKEDLIAIAIVADSPQPIPPCGLCRQVISEFFPKHGLVIMANLKGDVVDTTVDTFLPFAFGEKDLK